MGVGDVLAGRVEELFAVVKGVGDVLAELDVELGVTFSLVSRASVTCLLGWSGVWTCFMVSRASMTCLLVWSRVLVAVFMAMGG